MTRMLTDHKVNELNEAIDIAVLDEPGAGGANHVYECVLGAPPAGAPAKILKVEFQNGPIKEAGCNGFTQEVLMAIVIDRLRSFQAGQYACRENAIALTHFETGLMWLHQRTRARLARGVEGTHEK
jgi:hypothetical protein